MKTNKKTADSAPNINLRNHLTTDMELTQDLARRKNAGLALAASYDRLAEARKAPQWATKAIRVRECGTYLGVVSTDRNPSTIVAANFCRERLCPACQRRRSLRIWSCTSQILDAVDDGWGDHVKYLFLTLTVKSCRLEALSDTLTHMADAWARWNKTTAWRRRVMGSIRTTEITINKDTGLAHPHYHVILAVHREYGRKGNDLYWSQDEWAAKWRQFAGLDYDPIVYISRVKGERGSQVAEVSKYLAKDSDYIIDSQAAQMGQDEAEALTDYRVAALTEQLRGKRLVAYAGIFFQVRKDLAIDDPEDGPLTDYLRGDVVSCIRHYHWHAGLSCYLRSGPCRDTIR